MTSPSQPQKLNTKKASLPIIIFHWVLVLSIIISFLSGQRIASDHLYDEAIRSSWTERWLTFLPQGTVFDWHYASGYLLLIFLSAYLLFIFISGHYRFLAIHLTDKKTTKWNKATIWMGLALLSLQGISGIIINLEKGNGGAWLRDIHRLSAWSFVIYIIAHLTVIALANGLRHWLYLFFASIKSTRLATITLLAGWGIATLLTQPASRSLDVLATKAPPKVDGLNDDPVWQQAQAITVHTKHGNADRDIAVEVKAAHDGERLYLLLRWPDTEASLNHLPLIKTKAGWTIENTQLTRHDERIYYEDKFAVMLSNQSAFAALRSIHLGQTPLKNQPEPKHQRGYHYTDNEIVDIWHWKAVRSNGFFQADDNYFGKVKQAQSGALRYKAGYEVDPSNGGGYESNFDFYRGEASPIVTPLRLPRNTERSWMRWSDGNAYHPRIDQLIAVGQTIPGTVTHGPFEGDRGDVGARGTWKDGYWQLEISRAFDTNSDFDTRIQPGTRLWFAVFDHSQTRHSYHLWPVTLWWEQ